MHNMLKACLNSAVKARLILRNPATGCKLPKAEKKEMKVLTPAALDSLPLATYTHATNKVQEQAAAKMGNLLKQAL